CMTSYKEKEKPQGAGNSNPKSDPKHIFDNITLSIVDTLLDNPTIPYNKKQLAEAAKVSRAALHKRFPTLVADGIIKEKEVGSVGKYWQLNEDSRLVNAMAETLHRNSD
ncbi:MAG: winged helix-turn-helix domain-containing protein, partial [Candidatus Nanohaloarchaea archaeon]